MSDVAMHSLDSFYTLPLGKPNPHEPRGPSIKDCRSRVPQKGATEWTTWFYAIKMIAERHPHEEEAGLRPVFLSKTGCTRRIEWHFSDFRRRVMGMEVTKEFRDCSDEMQRSAVYDLARHLFNDLKEELPDGPFKKTVVHFQERLEKLEVESLRSHAPVFSLVSLVMAFLTNGVCTSSWKKEDGLGALKLAIEFSGPMAVHGKFGQVFYSCPARVVPNRVEGRTVMCWPSGAKEKKVDCHLPMVVITAVNKQLGERDWRVSFRDPRDSSDPQNPASRRVYRVSGRKFLENVGPVAYLSDGKVVWGFHGKKYSLIARNQIIGRSAFSICMRMVGERKEHTAGKMESDASGASEAKST